MNKKICVKCNLENEPSFRYCRRCGAVLPVVEQKAPINAEVVLENSDPFYADKDVIDGVSARELEAYVGKNHSRILDSFYRMSLLNKKTSFCLPVLLLGLFFGFFGISCWFFYRKMNKYGFLFLAFPLVFFLVDLIFNFDVSVRFLKDYTSLLSSFAADTEQYRSEANQIFSHFYNNFHSVLPDFRNLLEGMVAPIVMSFFSLYLYKNKAVKDIKNLRESYAQDSNYLLRLFLLGGTSAARVLIPFAVSVGFYFILSFSAFLFIF